MLLCGMEFKNFMKFVQEKLHIRLVQLDSEPIYLKELPLALKKSYPITRIRVHNKTVGIVHVEDTSKGAISKHYEIINSKTEYPVVLYLPKESKKLKNYLIEKNISFVIENDTIYFPQLAIYMSENEKEVFKLKPKRSKFSKSAQLTLLYYLLYRQIHRQEHPLAITELSSVLQVSAMTASRALIELYEQKIFTMHQEGNAKAYELSSDEVVLETILSQMKAPKNGSVYIHPLNIEYFRDARLSGSSALSRYTDLIEEFRTYAIEKKVLKKVLKENQHIEVFDEAYDNNFIKLEMWNYPPSIIPDGILYDGSSNMINEAPLVDPISLYLNYQQFTVYDNNDIRFANAIDQLRTRVDGIIYG